MAFFDSAFVFSFQRKHILDRMLEYATLMTEPSGHFRDGTRSLTWAFRVLMKSESAPSVLSFVRIGETGIQGIANCGTPNLKVKSGHCSLIQVNTG